MVQDHQDTDERTPAVIERKGKRFLTRKEASEKLTAALGRGYTIRSVDRLIDRGVLVGVKFDGLQWVYIAEDKVAKLIHDRPRQVTDPATPPAAKAMPDGSPRPAPPARKRTARKATAAAR